MADAIKDLPNPGLLTLDFYDRTRLATWVRDHAGTILWIKEKIGKAIQGWHSYGAWAQSPRDVRDEYLWDDKARIQTRENEAAGSIDVAEGIRRIRERLHQPGKVVRLVGLSGVGKTRLAQALFDSRVGENALDPSLAIYTNIADSPDPHPTNLASDLVATGTKAFLVIDNCTPELHQRLSEVCRSSKSPLSLITIEYDVQDDQPEGTDVFSLSSSSLDLITKLLRNRFSEISALDARKIAELSDGNARVAIALAGTLGKNEAIGSLSDQDLFKRLFHQRNEPNESLLLAAEALSLVYSYDGEDTSSGEQSELFRLGALVRKGSDEMFRCTAELKRRELVQQRGRWRAVLPHAIANRLAATALQNVPTNELETHIISRERLLKSFSRRLGYLAGCKEAEAIIKRWLGAGGLLANARDLNELGHAVFTNIAPVLPELTLSTLERSLENLKDSDLVRTSKRYIHLLRSLAYEPSLFDRCVRLMVKIVTEDTQRENEASRAFASLFPIYFSGTHATLGQRLAVINTLVRSADHKKRGLGVMGLRAALEASHFGPAYNFDFGVRSRDYGYSPTDRAGVIDWYRQTLNFARELASSDAESASEIRRAIAGQLRGLWTNAKMYEDLEGVSHAISKGQFWAEGWIAVREIIAYDSKGFTAEVSERLTRLEELLRPKDIIQKIRSIVLSEAVTYVGIETAEDGSNDIVRTMASVNATARELGRAVANDPHSLAELLPDLLTGTSTQLWSFGQGLSEGSANPAATWQRLVDQLAATPEDSRQIRVFLGFLNKLHESRPDLANSLLDHAVENEPLAPYYPVLQTAIGVNELGLQRLIRSLSVGKAYIRAYGSLSGGRATDSVPSVGLKTLILDIARKSQGFDVAINILYMRIHSDIEKRSALDTDIIDTGSQLIRQLTFTKSSDGQEHRLGLIARNCLVGTKGAEVVEEICGRLRASISKYETHIFYHDDLLEGLFRAQPIAALEGLCPRNGADAKSNAHTLEYVRQLRRNPLYLVPEDDLLNWCDQEPNSRYPAIAGAINVFRSAPEVGDSRWSTLALQLLARAPDRIEVLKRFIDQLSPLSWTGSRATIIENNAKLLDELEIYPDAAVRQFVSTTKSRLNEAVTAERGSEAILEREIQDRFE